MWPFKTKVSSKNTHMISTEEACQAFRSLSTCGMDSHEILKWRIPSVDSDRIERCGVELNELTVLLTYLYRLPYGPIKILMIYSKPMEKSLRVDFEYRDNIYTIDYLSNQGKTYTYLVTDLTELPMATVTIPAKKEPSYAEVKILNDILMPHKMI